MQAEGLMNRPTSEGFEHWTVLLRDHWARASNVLCYLRYDTLRK